MKSFITVLFLIFSFNSNASVSHYLSCKLDSKSGPLKDFAISFEAQEQDYFGVISKVNFVEANWDESLGVDEFYITQRNAQFYYDGKTENEIHFEFVDWAGTTIKLGEDDEGHYAFVEFFSDGPESVGFYRCKKEFVSAWQLLESALNADTALSMKVAIASEASCGEYDPYFLGDTCSYSAYLIEENKKTKIQIFFYDYDMDSLKKGQVIDVQGVNITGEDVTGEHPAYAVQ